MVFRKLGRFYKKQDIKKPAVVASLVVMGIIWPGSRVFHIIFPETMLGIAGNVAVPLFLVPVLIGGSLAVFCRFIDDTECHIQAFENE